MTLERNIKRKPRAVHDGNTRCAAPDHRVPLRRATLDANQRAAATFAMASPRLDRRLSTLIAPAPKPAI